MSDTIDPSGLIPEIIADTTAVVSTVNTVSADITKTTSSVKTIILVITLIGAIIGLLFSKGCISLPHIQILPTVVNNVASIKVSDNTVTYTPNTKNAKSITVYKPFESSPTLINGKLTIPHIGFCSELFVGYSFTVSDQLRPYLSARLIYWDNAGFDLGINDKRGFAGISYRLPIISLATISAGETLSYQLIPELYFGLNLQLSL